MEIIFTQKFISGTFYVTLAAYLLAALFYWAGSAMRIPFTTSKYGRVLLIIGFAGNTLSLLFAILKYSQSGLTVDLFRLINTYQFALMFTWFVVALNMTVVRKEARLPSANFYLPLVIILLLYLLSLPSTSEGGFSIYPIYRSWWLLTAMVASALAYGAFALAFGLGIMYLLKEYLNKINKRAVFTQYLPNLEVLDELGYRLASFGFPFFTLSIIFGAIWANNALARFWSWQPKETWSFVSWLAYVAYFHVRLLHDWRGNRSAWMLVMGFLAILFTFIGVSYFLPGPSGIAP